MALQTLWIAPYLRDVGGYTPAQVARGLLAVNMAMIAGYLGFGWAAEVRSRSGRSVLPRLLAQPANGPRRATLVRVFEWLLPGVGSRSRDLTLARFT